MKRLVASVTFLALLSGCSSSPAPVEPVATVTPAASTPTPDLQAFRSRAPEPMAPRPYRFPEVTRVTLDNGLRVLVAENRGAPLATIRALIRSGADQNPSAQAGVASFTADMLDEGAAGRSAIAIAEKVADLGGTLITASEWDASTLNLDLGSSNVEEGIKLVSDVLIRPTFPAAEIDRIRKDRLTTILQQRDDANILATNRFASVVYAGTAYGDPIIGSAASVKAISRKAINDFYRTHYVPNNVSLIVSGDVDTNTVIQLLRRQFSTWERGKDIRSVAIAPKSIDANRIYIIDRPQAVQSEIRVGHIGVSRATEDYFPFLTMNMLLGGNFSSRINLNLREKHGYTYGARTSQAFRRQAGPFVVSTPVRNEVTLQSVQEIMNELQRIRTGEITEQELNNTRNYLMGVFPATVESASDLADRLQELELYNLPEDYFNSYREKIASVTAEELTRVGNKYVQPGQSAIVIVGKASDIQKPLSQLGYPVTVYDIDGRPVTE